MVTTTHITDQPGFTFDEARHEYRVGDQVVPSVTQILSDLGYSNYEIVERLNPEALERKRQIGKLVHQACHFFDENDLIEKDLPEVIYQRLQGYKKFRADTGYAPTLNEGRGIGDLYGMKFGMQFDSIGMCHGKLPYWLVDIKNASGSAQRAWGLQTAAYAMGQKLLPKVAPSAFVRVIVQLDDESGYKLYASKDRGSKIFKPEDFQVWPACLAVSIDKRNHNLERR